MPVLTTAARKHFTNTHHNGAAENARRQHERGVRIPQVGLVGEKDPGSAGGPPLQVEASIKIQLDIHMETLVELLPSMQVARYGFFVSGGRALNLRPYCEDARTDTKVGPTWSNTSWG